MARINDNKLYFVNIIFASSNGMDFFPRQIFKKIAVFCVQIYLYNFLLCNFLLILYRITYMNRAEKSVFKVCVCK